MDRQFVRTITLWFCILTLLVVCLLLIYTDQGAVLSDQLGFLHKVLPDNYTKQGPTQKSGDKHNVARLDSQVNSADARSAAAVAPQPLPLQDAEVLSSVHDSKSETSQETHATLSRSEKSANPDVCLQRLTEILKLNEAARASFVVWKGEHSQLTKLVIQRPNEQEVAVLKNAIDSEGSALKGFAHTAYIVDAERRLAEYAQYEEAYKVVTIEQLGLQKSTPLPPMVMVFYPKDPNDIRIAEDGRINLLNNARGARSVNPWFEPNGQPNQRYGHLIKIP